MRVNDFYKILEVTPGATPQDIKKAFRQLAMRYHPDKNPGNESAAAHFRAVKEAYLVLSDPARRSAYNQQRWYKQHPHREYEAQPLTPLIILKKVNDLSRYVSKLDSSRLNQESLYQYIMHFLQESSITLLVEWNDTAVNTRIITELLSASQFLSSRYFSKIGTRLVRLAGTDNQLIKTIHTNIKQRKITGYWQKYQALIILIITLLLCWIIFLTGS